MVKKIIKFVCKKLHLTKKETKYKYCRRCGRLLKNEESMQLGLGKHCYHKEVQTKYTKSLF